jgi:hypothetical protein
MAQGATFDFAKIEATRARVAGQGYYYVGMLEYRQIGK